MKKILLTAMVLTLSAMFSNAQDGLYTIKNGNITMTVNANEAGKIVSLKYGDKEVLSQLARPNAYGSTFWTSPQKEWNWPPVPAHDMLPDLTFQFGDRLVCAGQLSEQFPIRIIKTFYADPKDGSIVIEYTAKNDSDIERSIAPWEITRVPNGGMVFYDAPVESIWPDDLMKYTSAYGLSWYLAEQYKNYRKTNADAKGWIAYVNEGLLFVKCFDDIPAGAPAPGEAEVQLYVHNGKTYFELEGQGAYTALKPGESLTWKCKWFLVPVDAWDAPSAELAKTARRLGNSKL